MTSDEEIDDRQGFLSFISPSEVLWAAIVFCQSGGVYATETKNNLGWFYQEIDDI
jgi:hypothetical protein